MFYLEGANPGQWECDKREGRQRRMGGSTRWCVIFWPLHYNKPYKIKAEVTIQLHRHSFMVCLRRTGRKRPCLRAYWRREGRTHLSGRSPHISFLTWFNLCSMGRKHPLSRPVFPKYPPLPSYFDEIPNIIFYHLQTF